MSSQASPSPAGLLPWRLPQWLRVGVRIAAAVLLVAFGLLLAAWLIFHWGILPHIDDWRPQIEARASRALGLPLKIGRIDVRSAGWVPAFELHDVRVSDRQGREALRLARVAVALSPRSLLVLEPRFEQLLVDDVELDVRRDVQGRLHVAGLDLGAGSGSDDPAAADWLFAQHEVVFRRVSLRWTDEQRGATPLVLSDAQLVLRNGLRSHALRFDATPPAAWGQRFSLRGRFTQALLARPGHWQGWRGSVFADLPHTDVAGLGRLVDLPFELHAGRGALRAWVEIDNGQATGATVDLALAEVSLRLAPTLAALTLEGVHGRLTAARDARGVQLEASDFGFQTGAGAVWPAGRLTLAWSLTPALDGSAPPGAVSGGEFSADRLDLALMAQIADQLPLGQALHGALKDWAPQGVLQQLAGRWDGPLDAPRHYQLRARGTRLSVAAAPVAAEGRADRSTAAPAGPGRPGVSNADIEFTATEAGGEAQLAVNDGALEFPGVFARPRLPMQRLSGQLAWTLTPPARSGVPAAIELRLNKVHFANDDVEGQLDAVWKSGADAPTPGLLDLSGTLAQARADRVVHYLPLALPAAVRDYVADAVQGGQVTSASFRVKGELRDFPFVHAAKDGSNEFQIKARLQDVQLAYVPGQRARGDTPALPSPWPVFTQVRGELVFERGAMRLRDVQAVQGDIALRDVQGGIKDFRQSVLQIDGRGRGPLAEWLRFVDNSPVGEWVGLSLHQASGSGNADLKLALTIPLAAPEHTTVRGSVLLAGSTLKLRPDVPALEDTRGRVDFTEGSVAIIGATARFLGGDASFEGGSAPNGGLRFSARGSVSAEALRLAPEAAALAPLAARLRGQAAYMLQLGFLRGRPEITLTSSLVGMAIDLPAPLAKPANAAWPLRLQNTLLPDTVVGTVTGTPRDNLRFDLGKVVQARFVRDLSGAEARIERGGIAVFDEVPTPASGVAASLKLGAVDVDEWRSVADALVSAGPAGGAGAGLLPQTVSLRAERLTVGQRRLTGVVLDLDCQDDALGATWRARVQADQADGRVELRLPREGPPSVKARLARLSLPPAEPASVEALLQAVPASVPALDIVIDELEWLGRPLGRIEVEAVNQASRARPGALEWRLTRLNLNTPEASLRASGVWAPGSAGPGISGRRMAVDFRLTVSDSGAFTERLGAARAMRGGKGEVHGQLSWAGSPLAPDTGNMDGRFSLALEEGQLLNVDPGAARLLGVLSLQMLPRRLLLDFSDITQEGFGFDSITGDFQMTHGVVSTSNLRVSGTQAAVQMDGRIDLPRETQDLRVVVVPEISTGAAALAVAAVNPAMGLGTLLAGTLLRRPLAAAATREFRVSGDWATPRVDRIDGRRGGPSPGSGAGAARGSSAE